MNTINIAILDIHPDTLKIAYFVRKYLENNYNIVWHILHFLSSGDSPNPITGTYFTGKVVNKYNNVHDIVSSIYALDTSVICISEKRNQNVSLSSIVLGETFDHIETGSRLLNYRYSVESSKLKPALDSIVSNVIELNISKNGMPNQNVSVSRIANQKERPNRKIILVCSEGYFMSSPGTGMYQLLERLTISIAKLCASTGYNLKLTSEVNSESLVIQKEDIVILLTVNGMYGGGFTNIWQGFKMKNLLVISNKLKQIGAKGIMVSSAHSSEFALYPTAKKSDLDIINNFVFSGFHPAINKELERKGMNYKNGSFPIPIQTKWLLDQSRIAKNYKTIMLQFDTQSRKNGEYILAAVCDAYYIAIKSNPDLKLKVICKATAAHSIGGPSYLNKLKQDWNINHPNLDIILEGRSSKSWADVLKEIDIFIGLSTEEGLHYFIPELWIAGATIVLGKNGPCNSFESLPEGICLVNTLEVEGSGTGFYNDNFYSKVKMFDYNDTVLSLSKLLSSEINIKDRKELAKSYFDVDGSLIKSYLGLSSDSQYKTFSVEREGLVYQNIIQSSEWPK